MHPEHTVWHSSSSVSNNLMQLVFICAERDLGRGTPNSSIRHLDVKVVLVSAACLSLAPHTWFTRLLCKVHLLLRLPLMPLTSDRSLYRAEQGLLTVVETLSFLCLWRPGTLSSLALMMQPQARSCTSFPLEGQRGEGSKKKGLGRSTHHCLDVEMFTKITVGVCFKGLSPKRHSRFQGIQVTVSGCPNCLFCVDRT